MKDCGSPRETVSKPKLRKLATIEKQENMSKEATSVGFRIYLLLMDKEINMTWTVDASRLVKAAKFLKVYNRMIVYTLMGGR